MPMADTGRAAVAEPPAGAGPAENTAADPGFQHFYNLEYEEALKIFRARVTANPGDASSRTALAQTVLYYEMYRNHALDSDLIGSTNPFVTRPKLNVLPEHQREFQMSINRAMELSQKRLDADPRDRNALYTLGVAYGLRANWSFLVTKEYMSTLRDATQARKLHNQASEVDPNFMDARFMQAVHDYVVGSLPIGWKLLGFLAGFRGDRDGGIRTMEQVAQQGSASKVDAAVLLAAVLRREKRSAEAIPFLAPVTEQFPRNHLFRLELSRLYADAGDKVRALSCLDRLDQMRLKGAAGYSDLTAERLSYLKGNVHFWYGELDAAVTELRRATSRPSGLSADESAMAWLRLGQTLDLKGDRAGSRFAYEQVVRVAPQSEIAREAKGYVTFPYKRKRQQGQS